MNFFVNKFAVTFSYPVIFAEKIFDKDSVLLKDLLSPVAEGRKILFVVDAEVKRAHPFLQEAIEAYFKTNLPGVTCCSEFVVVPGGESAKNEPQHLQALLEAIERNGICRHSFLAAIGGGAVLDLAGFAAAIAHRGVKHLRFPTTVLSQNDSGVGVKNGVNAFQKKNFIGSFAPPYAVINDFAFLGTLAERDWRSGISEAVKVALIKDREFFSYIENYATALRNRELAPMKELIMRCAKMHMDHIAGGDPFESGSSRPLDFGHWAAHKLEQLSQFAWKHGEAVAVGIALDATISLLNRMITETAWKRILHVLTACGFRIYAPELAMQGRSGRHQLLDGLNEFREHLGGRLTIMLLEEIGKGKEVHEMDDSKVLRAMEMLKQMQEECDRQEVAQEI